MARLSNLNPRIKHEYAHEHEEEIGYAPIQNPRNVIGHDEIFEIDPGWDDDDEGIDDGEENGEDEEIDLEAQLPSQRSPRMREERGEVQKYEEEENQADPVWKGKERDKDLYSSSPQVHAHASHANPRQHSHPGIHAASPTQRQSYPPMMKSTQSPETNIKLSKEGKRFLFSSPSPSPLKGSGSFGVGVGAGGDFNSNFNFDRVGSGSGGASPRSRLRGKAGSGDGAGEVKYSEDMTPVSARKRTPRGGSSGEGAGSAGTAGGSERNSVRFDESVDFGSESGSGSVGGDGDLQINTSTNSNANLNNHNDTPSPTPTQNQHQNKTLTHTLLHNTSGFLLLTLYLFLLLLEALTHPISSLLSSLLAFYTSTLFRLFCTACRRRRGKWVFVPVVLSLGVGGAVVVAAVVVWVGVWFVVVVGLGWWAWVVGSCVLEREGGEREGERVRFVEAWMRDM